MDLEQKEGVLIVSVSITILIIVALLTTWSLTLPFSTEVINLAFSQAYFGWSGIEYNCPYGPNLLNDCEYLFGFTMNYMTLLIIFIPIILYGLLRAFGIVGRLIPHEEWLFRFMDR